MSKKQKKNQKTSIQTMKKRKNSKQKKSLNPKIKQLKKEENKTIIKSIAEELKEKEKIEPQKIIKSQSNIELYKETPTISFEMINSKNDKNENKIHNNQSFINSPESITSFSFESLTKDKSIIPDANSNKEKEKKKKKKAQKTGGGRFQGLKKEMAERQKEIKNKKKKEDKE